MNSSRVATTREAGMQQWSLIGSARKHCPYPKPNLEAKGTAFESPSPAVP